MPTSRPDAGDAGRPHEAASVAGLTGRVADAVGLSGDWFAVVCRSRSMWWFRRDRRRLPSWGVLPLTLLVGSQTATPAWAWGRLGHRVTARVAELHLTPRAKTEIKGLLADGESLADCSTWADEHRRQVRRSAPWHYVDVPLDEVRYDWRFSGDDPVKGFIVDKIAEFRAILKDTSKPVEERRVALRFIVHLVGDLHQPLHVGDNHDRGGNDTQVRWFDRGSNMHRVWDSDLIEWNTRSEDVWLAELAELDTDKNRAPWMGGTVEDWATESLLAARAAYLVPGTDVRIKPGQKLSREYYDAHLPVVRRRLCQAGVRLAMVLNEVWPAD